MFYVTFGFGTNKAKCYAEVDEPNMKAAIDKVQSVVGVNYAFIYNEQDFAGQPEKYQLKKISLE